MPSSLAAGHGHDAALIAQALYDFGFLLRLDFCFDFRDAEFARHHRCNRVAVAGEHYQTYSVRTQGTNRFGGGGFDLV